MNNQNLKNNLESEIEFIKEINDDKFEIYVNPKNILKWYFLIKGQKDTDYAGGYYLGEISFLDKEPIEYPSCVMLTPTGYFRTKENINLVKYYLDQNTGRMLPCFDPDEVSETLYQIVYNKFDDIKHSQFTLPNLTTLLNLTTLPDKKFSAFSSVVYNKTHHPELVKKFPKFLDHNGNSPEHNQNIYIFWLKKCAVIDNLDLDLIDYLSKLFFYNI